MPFRISAVTGLLCGVALLVAGSPAPAMTQATVATIGTSSISSQELEARSAKAVAAAEADYDLQLHQLQKRLERERQSYRERELNAMVDERVLELEAGARKTTVAALTATIKPAEVTDTKVHEFYEANRTQIGQPFELISPKIKQYLEGQNQEQAKRAYLNSLRTKYKVSVDLEPLREAVAATGPVRGPVTAPVSIVIFSDFQCPFCQRYVKTLDEVMRKYPAQVRIIYRHLPLSSLHPQAEQAAEAAVCADKQGRFWEMHDLMFAEQNALSAMDLKQKAKRLGLDESTFAQCLDSDEPASTVRADKKAADELGLGGTPASFINGRFLNGAVSAAELGAIIDDELKRQVVVTRK